MQTQLCPSLLVQSCPHDDQTSVIEKTFMDWFVSHVTGGGYYGSSKVSDSLTWAWKMHQLWHGVLQSTGRWIPPWIYSSIRLWIYYNWKVVSPVIPSYEITIPLAILLVAHGWNYYGTVCLTLKIDLKLEHALGLLVYERDKVVILVVHCSEWIWINCLRHFMKVYFISQIISRDSISVLLHIICRHPGLTLISFTLFCSQQHQTSMSGTTPSSRLKFLNFAGPPSWHVPSLSNWLKHLISAWW